MPSPMSSTIASATCRGRCRTPPRTPSRTRRSSTWWRSPTGEWSAPLPPTMRLPAASTSIRVPWSSNRLPRPTDFRLSRLPTSSEVRTETQPGDERSLEPSSIQRLDHWIDEFISFARSERGLAGNTVDAYRRDLARWRAFCGLAEVDVEQPAPQSFTDYLERARSGRPPFEVPLAAS